MIETAPADGGSRFAANLSIHRKGELGPHITLLHGFPTSSMDYAGVIDELAKKHIVLAFDHLGFGDSDKPTSHRYSAFENADFTEAVWAKAY